MSYQEERIQEITNAIRSVTGSSEKIKGTDIASEVGKLKNPSGTLLIEENGTFDVTNYANAEVDINIVTPSGIKTITENGDYDVTDYAWASVNVEADLNERVIIGKWVNYEIGYFIEFKENGEGMYLAWEGTYTISGNNITIVVNNEFASPVTVTYNRETDTIIIPADETEPEVTLTRVQETATLITKEITENGTYTASDDGADGYSEVVVNVSGGGGATPFADATPEEIQQIGNEISAKGMTSAEVEATYGWKIGDTKDITLTTNEVIQVRIIGFNHDNLTGGGTAGITLEMANCLKTVYTLNNQNTNAGGWTATRFRNTTLPTIKATLPTEWQDIIVKVDKKSSDKNGINTVADDLFILSEIEVKGTITYAYNGQDEGSQYSYYLNGGSVIKDKSYWLRSIYNNDASFCLVRSDSGAVNYQGAWNYNNGLGIAIAFCVGSSPAPVVAGLPIELTTDTEMTNALVEDNLGKVYKFTGTSDTYETDAIYIVSEVE